MGFSTSVVPVKMIRFIMRKTVERLHNCGNTTWGNYTTPTIYQKKKKRRTNCIPFEARTRHCVSTLVVILLVFFRQADYVCVCMRARSVVAGELYLTFLSEVDRERGKEGAFNKKDMLFYFVLLSFFCVPFLVFL